MNPADVGVVKRGQHLGFALEAGQPVGVGRKCLGEHLQRHVPVELGVAGLVHLAHTTLANEAAHGVRADLRAFA